mgnify:CR=1 FL=1
MDFIKGELIDVIEWTDDSRDTLSFRFPDEDKEIKNGAQLIVRESQAVQFVYLGEFGDTFAFRAMGRVEAIVPTGVLFIFTSALGADRYRVTVSVLWIAAALLIGETVSRLVFAVAVAIGVLEGASPIAVGIALAPFILPILAWVLGIGVAIWLLVRSRHTGPRHVAA